MPDAYMPDPVVESHRADVHRLEREVAELRHQLIVIRENSDVHRLEHEVAELRRQLRAIREHSEHANRALCQCADQNLEMSQRLRFGLVEDINGDRR